ncbi:MAG: hypothetical protein J6386_03485 [Candidatus Synoicihabitans palmerolidicus]|nr:hypothetical protein [Candidatus Synoicihabitans palmerolidicus]
MISAFARAGQIFNEPTYTTSAQRAATFLRTSLYDSTTGHFARSFRDDRRDSGGFPEDYACLIQGLLDLYETDFDPAWLDWALKLQPPQDALFWEDEHGGYFANALSDSTVVLRLKADHDGAEPAATWIASPPFSTTTHCSPTPAPLPGLCPPLFSATPSPFPNYSPPPAGWLETPSKRSFTPNPTTPPRVRSSAKSGNASTPAA